MKHVDETRKRGATTRNIDHGEFDLVAVRRAVICEPDFPKTPRADELHRLKPFSTAAAENATAFDRVLEEA
jgi:2,4-dienoyl-CoA reductase-like NADH-dependent reductase (Old Yellow Enzyme family)